eukprot:NODE_46_length_32145_cov_0.918711.p13 type:complete len:359 gc:universal NODE_46_length_32145_cov_0.918711:6278-7354(+)
MSENRQALLEQKKRKLADLRRLRQKRYSSSNISANESVHNILESIELPNMETDENKDNDIPEPLIKNQTNLQTSEYIHFQIKLDKIVYEKSTQAQVEAPEPEDIEMKSISDEGTISLSPEDEMQDGKQNTLRLGNSNPVPLGDFVMEAAKRIENIMSIQNSTKHVYIYDQIEFKQDDVISCQFFRNDIALTCESGIYFRNSKILLSNVTSSLCHELIYLGTEYGSIHVYDSRTLQLINILNYHKYPIKQIEFSNNTLLSLSEDGELLLWNIKMVSEPIAMISTKPGALCMAKMHQYIVGCLDGMYSVTMQMNNRPQINDSKFEIGSVYSLSAMNEFALTASTDQVSLWHIPVEFFNVD